MAWIESHTTLKDHPKLFALMDRLAVNKAAAIGHLHLIWWWACDYASDGDLGKYSEAQIARAAEWGKEAKAFVEALAEVGFLERQGKRLVIHDWEEFRLHFEASHARVEKKREQVRERVRAFRERQRNGNAPVTQSNADNQTKPNRHNQTKRTDGTEPEGFAAFWTAYPRKESKKDALRSWDKIKPGPEIQASILADVKRRALSPAWQKDGGQFIPLPATYLNGRRWEDQGVVLPKPAPVPDDRTAAHLAARGTA